MKKLGKTLPALLAAAALAGLFVFSCQAATILVGDADRNGIIDAGDARYVLRAAVGLETPPEGLIAVCDADGNAVIEAGDARLLLRVSVSLEDLGGKTVTVDDVLLGEASDPPFRDVDAEAYTYDDYLTEDQRKKNAELIYYYLSEQLGWSRNAIIATLGNMEQESTLSPGLHEWGGSGYGLVQWTPGSRFTTWAQKNGYAADSMEGQLIYLNLEMQPGKGCWFRNANHPDYYESYDSFIHSTKDVEYLTRVFCYCFERPGIAMMSRRIDYANKWLAYLG